jgi:hypothetical protein
MTRALPRNLLTPVVYVVALVLLLEEWCWEAGKRLGARVGRAIAGWPGIAACEARVRSLPPYWALGAFVLPGLLLFPVKLLALLAIAHGHAVSGIATIVAAKLGGAVVVARIYTLTLPTLLALAWFARCHGWFMDVKARSLARLRAHAAHRSSVRLLRAVRLLLRQSFRHTLRTPRTSLGERVRNRMGGRRTLRVLRRFAAQWRSAHGRRRVPPAKDAP